MREMDNIKNALIGTELVYIIILTKWTGFMCGHFKECTVVIYAAKLIETFFSDVKFVIYSSDPWQYGEIVCINTHKFGHVYTG